MAVEAGSIGARLKAGREKMGLTVLQVAERIHTDAKIVEALEADNYSVLGAPVYGRGHIRHYGELVGESVADLLTMYANLSKVEQPDLTKIVKAPSTDNSNKLVASAVVILGVFAVAGAIWWVSALSKKKPQMSETHVVGDEQVPVPSGGAGAAGAPPAPVRTEPPPAALSSMPPSTHNAATDANTATAPTHSPTSGHAAPNSSTTSTHAPRGASGSSISSATPSQPTRVASAAPGPTSGTGASVATSGAAAAAPPPAHPKEQAQVTLRYSSDSWTEVYDASGARLFYDVGSANSVQTMVGTPPLRVVLGNASGVAVEFNGHSTPIAKLAHPDGSVQFSINRSGRVVRAKPVPDGG